MPIMRRRQLNAATATATEAVTHKAATTNVCAEFIYPLTSFYVAYVCYCYPPPNLSLMLARSRDKTMTNMAYGQRGSGGTNRLASWRNRFRKSTDFRLRSKMCVR